MTREGEKEKEKEGEEGEKNRLVYVDIASQIPKPQERERKN